MCKVTRYRFACWHHVKIRTSTCGATYIKHRRLGPSVACTSESYIQLTLSVECGPCQQSRWEESWKAKLDRARQYSADLKEGRTDFNEVDGAAMKTICKLVKSLETEMEDSIWSIRLHFPPLAKRPVRRLTEIGTKTYEQSRLRFELKPEDISTAKDEKGEEADDNSDSPWIDVPYNYDNPVYSIDGDWVDEFLARSKVYEDVDVEGELPRTYDSDDSQNAERGASLISTYNAKGWASSEVEDDAWEASEWTSTWEPWEESDQNGWDTDNDTPENRTTSAAELERIVAQFWAAVNNISNEADADDNDDDNNNEDNDTPLTIINIVPSKAQLVYLTTNHTTPKELLQSTHKPIETAQPRTSAPSSPSPAPPSRSLATEFEHRRRALLRYKVSHPYFYYAQWLELARKELRTVESMYSDPRHIAAPEHYKASSL